MTTCILCLGQLRKGKSVKLSEPVCDTFTLGDALRQQISSNILLPYTQSSSQLTCKSCLSSFQSFFKFLRKVNTNLSNFKTEKTFEVSPEFQQVYVQPNVLLLKMEPLVLLPRIKSEAEVTLNEVGLVKVDVFDGYADNLSINAEGSNGNTSAVAENNDNDRFSDDSDFAWSYDDPMDSLDSNEANDDVLNSSVGNGSKQKQCRKTKSCQKTHNSQEKEHRSLNTLDFGNQTDNTPEKCSTASRKSSKGSKRSNGLSDKSEVKVECSGDEMEPSEIKHKDSDEIIDSSEDEGPLLSTISTRSSKTAQNSTKLEGDSSKNPRIASKTLRKSTINNSSSSTSRTGPRRADLQVSTSNSISNLSSIPGTTTESVKSEISSSPAPVASIADIKPSTTDPNGPLPLFPAKSKTGYIRYLPRDQVTQEMVNSSQQYVVIDGVEYRIRKRPGSGKPKKNKRPAFIQEEDPSKRTHPARDPDGQQKVKSFIDIKCYVCGSEFETFFQLKKHFKRFHPDSQAYLTCCDRNFRRRCDLLDHIEQHERSAVHFCEICNKEYKTKGCLRTHMRFYHPKDGTEQVICYECGKMFNNSNLLKMHLLTHEGDSEKSFECYICSKKFKNIHNVKRHLKLTHALAPDRIICHICSASVKEAYLSSHMKYVHNSDRTRVNCERCGIWVLKSTYKVHLMKHTDMGVNCNVCGKFLKSTYSLTAHMKTVHNDNFKFKCNFCDKGFHREVKMQEHVAVKHTREFPFKCRVAECGREFRAEGNWRIHEKKAHPEEYNKLFKPFYKRDNEELKELEEMLGTKF